MAKTKIFRFDDVSINSDMNTTNAMADFLKEKFPGCVILFGVSPAVNDMSSFTGVTRERIFPKIFNAYSDHRIFFKVDKVGIPEFTDGVTLASHGLVHVDHRLLDKSAQEMSILISSSLVKSSVFIPPFNKYNQDTIDICKEHNIILVKFEDGWLCMEYNKYNPDHDKWYIHAREFTFEQFKNWFN